MPLRKEKTWHVLKAVKAAFGCVFWISLLLQQQAFGLDNITETTAKVQESDNGSSYCTDPGNILHGQRNPLKQGHPFFSNGTELEFICHSEYVFILGDGVITCISGHWVPPRKPLCIRYRIGGDKRSYCIPPPYTPYSVLNTAIYKEYDIGSTLHFDCLQGYQVVGSPVITCGEDGEWHPSPKCRLVYLWLKDIENRSASPDNPSLKSESTSIMKIISYLAVPVLVGFVIAIMLNLKNHTCLHLSNRPARASRNTVDSIVRGIEASHNHNNSIPSNIANLRLSFQHYLQPFRPPSYPYNHTSNVYNVSSLVPEMGLPTYEEAIKDSSPPSFDVACALESSTSHPASTNVTSDSSREANSTDATTETNRPSTA